MNVNIDSFYEGHTMDLVTFATRVCKMLGVETMIGGLMLSNVRSGYELTPHSYQCSRWSKRELRHRRHRMLKRRMLRADAQGWELANGR